MSRSVKEFLKLVTILQSHCESLGLLFGTQCKCNCWLLISYVYRMCCCKQHTVNKNAYL